MYVDRRKSTGGLETEVRVTLRDMEELLVLL